MFVSLFPILTYLTLAVEGTVSLHGSVSRRIVSGFEVDIKAFPYAVFLYFRMDRPSTCGSSLITLQAVVTSAHCLGELMFYNGEIHAYLGATVPMYSRVVRNVIKFITHPHYDKRRGKFDLGVAMFNREVPIMQGIHKIPISRKNIKLHDQMYTAGWGKKMPNVVPDFADARSLKASKQRLVSVARCVNVSGIKISPAFLCTEPINGYHYRGDLGNGLVTLKPFLALVGVVSFTVKDATLYGNLMYQRDWIQRTLKTLYGDMRLDPDCC